MAGQDLATIVNNYDFVQEFFNPSSPNEDTSSFMNFGMALSASVRQNAIFYDWSHGKFDPIAYFVHFFLGMAFSVQHSQRLKYDLNIDKIFWRFNGDKLKMFVSTVWHGPTISKKKVMLKCIQFNRKVKENIYEWTDEDIADVVSKIGPEMRYSSIESHFYDVLWKREIDGEYRQPNREDIRKFIGFIFTSDYNFDVKIRPALIKRRLDWTTYNWMEIKPFRPNVPHERYLDDHLNSMLLHPELRESIKISSKEFASHVIATFKHDLVATKYSPYIRTSLSEAHSGFVYGILTSFQQSHNYQTEVAQNDTSPDMSPDEKEKRIYELMVQQVKKRFVATATVSQVELDIINMPYYDFIKSVSNFAMNLRTEEMTSEAKTKKLNDAADFLAEQIKYEVLKKMIKDGLHSSDGKYLSRYLHGLFASSWAHDYENSIYTADYKAADDFEKSHRTNFVIRTEIADLDVMLSIHESDHFDTSILNEIREEEHSRNTPRAHKKSKYMMGVHILVSYALPDDHSLWPANEAGSGKNAESANMWIHTFFGENHKVNDDYVIKPLTHMDMKLQTALIEPFKKNRKRLEIIKKFINTKLPFINNFNDFSAFASGLFHDMRVVTNIARPGPNTMQFGFLMREGVHSKNQIVLVNFIYGKAVDVLSALDKLKDIVMGSRKQNSDHLAKILSIALIKNVGEETYRPEVFTEEHLLALDLCKLHFRTQRSSSRACESEELKKLNEETKLDDEKTPEVEHQLVTTQKYKFFEKLGRISGGIMTGLMAKNLLVDLIHGNFVGVAVNTGFIILNVLASKVSAKLIMKSGQLTAAGKYLLGNAFKAGAPFLARSPSFIFVGFDLYNNLQAMKNDTSVENMVSVGADGAYIALDLAESAIELAELAGVIEGVSAFTGPIGWSLGAALLVGVDIYKSVRQVQKIDNIVHLTGAEKFVEGIRSFIGLGPEKHITNLIDEKQINTKIVQKTLELMNDQSTIKRYITPIRSLSQNCPMDNYINFERKETFRVVRSVPDEDESFRYFCSTPDFSFCEGPSFLDFISNYFTRQTTTCMCTNAVGLEAKVCDSNLTYFQLTTGADVVQGFKYSPNVFDIGNGQKKIIGGDQEDIFILVGNSTTGYLDGGSKTNLLNCQSINSSSILLTHQHGLQMIDNNNAKATSMMHIAFRNMLQFYGRKMQPDYVTCWCTLNTLKTFGGTPNGSNDKIYIPNLPCQYNLTLTVPSNTVVVNKARHGDFNYHVTEINSGSSQITMHNREGTSQHVFKIDYNFYDFELIDTHIFAKFTIIRIKLSEHIYLILKFQSSSGIQVVFRDGVHWNIRKGHVVAMLETQDDLSTAEAIYAGVISSSTISMIIHSTLNNQSLTLSRGKHNNNKDHAVNVLYSNQDHHTHLKGSLHENVFSIMPQNHLQGNSSCIKFHDVTVHLSKHSDSKNLIDLMKVRTAVQMIDPRSDIIAKVSNDNNKNINITVSYYSKYVSESCDSSIGTIQIIDGIIFNEDANVIVMTKGPMTLKYDSPNDTTPIRPYLEPKPLHFNWSTNIIILSENDVDENMDIFIEKSIGQIYNYYVSNDTLVITNVLHNQSSNLYDFDENKFAIFMMDYFQSSAMQTLVLKFKDNIINLVEENGSIVKNSIDLEFLVQKLAPEEYIWNRIKQLPPMTDLVLLDN